MDWDATEAERRFGELLTLAATEGPQTIGRADVAFVLSPAVAYVGDPGRPRTFKEMLMVGPVAEDLVPPRDPSPPREVRW